jgi:hypothetical protein
MRDDVAQQQVVYVTWAEDAADHAGDTLDILPVVRDLAGREIGEVGHMTAAKHDRCMASRNGMPLKKSLTRSAAVEGASGEVRTERTRVTTLACVPIIWPCTGH